MFHVKHFNSFNVGVSDQTKTAGDAHLINVSLRKREEKDGVIAGHD